MSPDLATAQPYDWPRWAVRGMTDEPDHTRVPFGDYQIAPVHGGDAKWMRLGLLDRCYGPNILNAHCN